MYVCVGGLISSDLSYGLNKITLKITKSSHPFIQQVPIEHLLCENNYVT